MVVGIAWYKREEYDTLRRLFTDGDSLPDTYDKWLEKVGVVLKELRREGRVSRKVYIDPVAFPAWCASKGFQVNGSARAQFSAEAVRLGKAG